MSNIQDHICKICDILDKKQYDKLGYIRKLSQVIFDDVHKYLLRKSKDYSYQLDFTSQDLRILAKSISDAFKRWDNEMCPEKNIKQLRKDCKDGKINIDEFMKSKLHFMEYRRDYTQMLIELKSLMEYHAVYLYYLEIASGDEFAMKYTERIK